MCTITHRRQTRAGRAKNAAISTVATGSNHDSKLSPSVRMPRIMPGRTSVNSIPQANAAAVSGRITQPLLSTCCSKVLPTSANNAAPSHNVPQSTNVNAAENRIWMASSRPSQNKWDTPPPSADRAPPPVPCCGPRKTRRSASPPTTAWGNACVGCSPWSLPAHTDCATRRNTPRRSESAQ